MKKESTVTLTRNNVWFSDQKEQVYFHVTLTLPRVGEINAKFHADRYVAHDWEKKGDAWTEWRYTLDGDYAGIGPKTRKAVYDVVEPVLRRWIESPEYVAAYQTAVAYFVRNEITRHNATGNGKRMFEKYRSQLSHKAHVHISQALDHIEAANALLDDLT